MNTILVVALVAFMLGMFVASAITLILLDGITVGEYKEAYRELRIIKWQWSQNPNLFEGVGDNTCKIKI